MKRWRSSLLALALSSFALVATPTRAAPLLINLITGLPLLRADLNTRENKAVGAKYMVAVDLIKPLSSFPVAFGVYYQGFFKSNYGTLPINNTGVNVYYFPFGTPNQTFSIDDDVQVYTWRTAVFFRVATGFSFFNFRDTTADSVTFGATAVNFQTGAGVDYPLNDWLSIGAEGNFLVTFGGKDPDDTDVNAAGYMFASRLTFTWP